MIDDLTPSYSMVDCNNIIKIGHDNTFLAKRKIYSYQSLLFHKWHNYGWLVNCAGH